MNNIKTLTVYLGSSGHAKDIFQNSAAQMGELIGKHGMKLVYGGMDAGLMGRVASAALQSGAHVTGIIPRNLKDSERILPNLSETIMVEDLWDRKKRMFRTADAIITLPGGFGTADEALEVLYWGNLGLHNKPLVLVNIENYWDDMIAYLETLPDFDPRFLVIVDSVEDVIPALSQYCHPVGNAEGISHERDPEKSSIEDAAHMDPRRLNQPAADRGDDSLAEPHYPHFEDEITRDTKEPILIDQASIENTYYAICALGLKQLHKHKRAIGFLNKDGEFDDLLKWFETAEREKFITENCLKLFTVGTDEQALREELRGQQYIEIDLHNAKWGETEG